MSTESADIKGKGNYHNCKKFTLLLSVVVIPVCFLLRIKSLQVINDNIRSVMQQHIRKYDDVHSDLTLQYKYCNSTGWSFPQGLLVKYKHHLHNLHSSLVDTATMDIVKNFVYVTASSDNHFGELLALISYIQNHDPGRVLYVYDLGLNERHIRKVKNLCSVTYKKFQFKNFPRHVAYLKYYAWKPLIILDILATETAVWWVDSSQRLLTNNYTLVYNKVMETNGIALLYGTSTSIYSVTHPTMYEYIPTNKTSLMQTDCLQSTMFVVKTKMVYKKILWWYFLCSLLKKCIAPINKLTCEFQVNNLKTREDRFYTYSNCHRYDMSLINLLLANNYKFQVKKYGIYKRSNFKIQRGKNRLGGKLRTKEKCSKNVTNQLNIETYMES